VDTYQGPPAEGERTRVKVDVAPTSNRLQLLEPFKAWSGEPGPGGGRVGAHTANGSSSCTNFATNKKTGPHSQLLSPMLHGVCTATVSRSLAAAAFTALSAGHRPHVDTRVASGIVDGIVDTKHFTSHCVEQSRTYTPLHVLYVCPLR
jgi:hypothetical protein